MFLSLLIFGNRKRGSTLKFPEESIQSLINPDGWWEKDTSKVVRRGRLIQAYVPHVEQIPNKLSVVGRKEAEVHTSAQFEIVPFRYGEAKKHISLPVAALPAYPGEEYLVYRSKRRPLLVIADNSLEVENKLVQGKPKWQTAPTLLVAPYYGRDEGTGTRSGFNDSFVERVRQCEYPQFFWDMLPLPGANESIMRLDHIQPVGSHHNTFHVTDYRLNQDAMLLLDEWLDWYIFECLEEQSMLADVIKTLQK
jgi:hypothetical protein